MREGWRGKGSASRRLREKERRTAQGTGPVQDGDFETKDKERLRKKRPERLSRRATCKAEVLAHAVCLQKTVTREWDRPKRETRGGVADDAREDLVDVGLILLRLELPRLRHRERRPDLSFHDLAGCLDAPSACDGGDDRERIGV